MNVIRLTIFSHKVQNKKIIQEIAAKTQMFKFDKILAVIVEKYCIIVTVIMTIKR